MIGFGNRVLTGRISSDEINKDEGAPWTQYDWYPFKNKRRECHVETEPHGKEVTVRRQRQRLEYYCLHLRGTGNHQRLKKDPFLQVSGRTRPC